MYQLSPDVFLSRTDLTVLGIDPSIQACGYGVLYRGKVLESGIIRSKSSAIEFARYEKIEGVIHGLLERFRPDIVAIEQFDAFFLGTSGRHNRARMNPSSIFLLKGAQTTIVQTCLNFGCGVVLYLPRQWKQGNAGKEDVMAIMNARYGLQLKDNNITDAIGIADFYLMAGKGITPVMYRGDAPDDAPLFVPEDSENRFLQPLTLQRDGRKGKKVIPKAKSEPSIQANPKGKNLRTPSKKTRNHATLAQNTLDDSRDDILNLVNQRRPIFREKSFRP